MRFVTPVTIVLFSLAIGCSKPDPVAVPVDTSAAVKPSQDEQLEKLRQESVLQEAKLKELAEQVELQKAKDLEVQRAKELQAENEAQRLKQSQEANEARAKQAKRLQREKQIRMRMDDFFACQKPDFSARMLAAADLIKEGKEITTADRDLVQHMNLVLDKLADKVPFDDSDRQYLTEIGLEWWGTPEATAMYVGHRAIRDEITSHSFIRDVKMVSKAFAYSWDETAAFGEWYLRQLSDPYTHNPNKMIDIHECIQAERDITPWLEYSKQNPFVKDMVKQYHDRMRTPAFAALVAKNELDLLNTKIEAIKSKKDDHSKNIAGINSKTKPLELQINRMQNVDSKRGVQKLEELQGQLKKLTDERGNEISAIRQLDSALEELTSK